MSENSKGCSDSTCESSSCEGCKSNTANSAPENMHEKFNEYSSVKKVIGIVSGKGGVGKSFVTAMMAVLMNRKGYNVGILDADITGPSIPKMFGIKSKAKGSELGIHPERTHNNIEIMSVNLLLEQEETPVIWRGPILAGTVKQFWSDVFWGDLDYMFIDMPPGTGDVPLTIYQSIPLDGIIIVTSPQDLVSLIVKKAHNMAKQMNVPILGVVENMSYVKCPDCDKKIHLFGESKIEEVAKSMDLKILGKLPIDTKIAELVDEGEFEKFYCEELNEAAEMLAL